LINFFIYLINQYIIGNGGANIKEIEKEASVKLNIDQKAETVEIAGDNAANIQKGFKAVLQALKHYYWFYDEAKKEFFEDHAIRTSLFFCMLSPVKTCVILTPTRFRKNFCWIERKSWKGSKG